jgi:hypothetical protein
MRAAPPFSPLLVVVVVVVVVILLAPSGDASARLGGGGSSGGVNDLLHANTAGRGAGLSGGAEDGEGSCEAFRVTAAAGAGSKDECLQEDAARASMETYMAEIVSGRVSRGVDPCYPLSNKCAANELITREAVMRALGEEAGPFRPLREKAGEDFDMDGVIWKAIVLAGYVESPDFSANFGEGCRKLLRNQNPFWLDIGQRVADLLAVSSVDDKPFPGKCAFWSGGIDVSHYARATGFTTLENSKSGNAFDKMNPHWGSCKSETHIGWERLGPVWNTLSKDYAKRCQGEVSVFMRAIDEGSVLFKQEFPQLKMMTKEAGESSGQVTLTYKFLLGNSDESLGKVSNMLIFSGGMTIDDIKSIRTTPYIFRRLTQCNQASTGSTCSMNLDEAQWPDIKIVFKVLWRHYLRTKYWCDMRFTSSVHLGSSGSAGVWTSTKEELVDNPENTNWAQWKQLDVQAQSLRGPPFWATSDDPAQSLKDKVPKWGFAVDRLTNDPVNVRVHASEPEEKYKKWTEFCRGFLLDRWGFEKNLLAMDTGRAVVAGTKMFKKRAADRIAGNHRLPERTAAYGGGVL